MPRYLLAIAVLFGLIVGAGAMYQLRPATGPDEDGVRAIVSQMLEEQPPIIAPSVDVAQLGTVIEDYMLGNPMLLQRMSVALDQQVKTTQMAATKAAIAEYRSVIFDDPASAIVGNPDGDVTLVEMFDYNCGYCRGALPDLVALIAEDPNLRVVLKEFPILSADSVDAARVAVLVSQQRPADYWAFHQKLFTGRGTVTGQSALSAATELGLNAITLGLELQSAEVSAEIQKSYDIATALKISGTPTYILGDELIPGAVPIEDLRARIANMRACGSTTCDTPG